MMNSSALLSLALLFVAIHQSQCSLWENFRNKYFEPRDSLACYKTTTLELYKHLKQVLPSYCVENEESKFNSSVKPRSKLFSLISKNGPNKDLFEERMKQAEELATEGIANMRLCLIYRCNNGVQEKVMEFVKAFKDKSEKCGDPNYLSSSILQLQQTCPEKEKEGKANGFPSYVWKSAIHDHDYWS